MTHAMLAFEYPGGWNDVKGSTAVTVLQFLLGGGGSFSAGGPGEQSQLLGCHAPHNRNIDIISNIIPLSSELQLLHVLAAVLLRQQSSALTWTVCQPCIPPVSITPSRHATMLASGREACTAKS